MTTADLLNRVQAIGLILWRDGDRLRYRGPPEAVDALLPELRAHKSELLAALGSKLESRSDPAAEERRNRVLATLESNPNARYAVLADAEADPQAVVVTLAIRGRTTCELAIPREKWDGILFLELLEKHCTTGVLH